MVCVTIQRSRGYFTRDIAYPFFSDVGRDPPNTYIFTFGLAIAACFQIICVSFIHRRVVCPMLRDVNAQSMWRLAYTALSFGILAAPFLPLIGWFPVNSHERAHAQVAKAYFVLTLISHLMYLALYYYLYQKAGAKHSWRASVKTWGIRRALLLPCALPYLLQNLIPTFQRRYLSYDEAMTRVERACPGITERSLQSGLQPCPWRRKDGKSFTDPYESCIAPDEFQHIPEGDVIPKVRMTTLQSFAHCKAAGYLITMSQSVSIFTLILTFTTFYYDFVNFVNVRRNELKEE